MKTRLLPIIGMLVLVVGCWIASAKAQTGSNQAALTHALIKSLVMSVHLKIIQVILLMVHVGIRMG